MEQSGLLYWEGRDGWPLGGGRDGAEEPQGRPLLGIDGWAPRCGPTGERSMNLKRKLANPLPSAIVCPRDLIAVLLRGRELVYSIALIVFGKYFQILLCNKKIPTRM